MSAPGRPHNSIARVALTAAAGTTIEYYDFFVYGTAAALVFPKLFFSPGLSPFVAQIAAFSTFTVGFLARPLGGTIFGHFGDLYGRKKALVAALLIMGCATTLIGFLPTYAVVGDLAPLLLISLRFVQGLALGGQWGGAALIAIENAPKNLRGYYGSFAQIGVSPGLMAANVVFLIMGAFLSPSEFASWGWRVPFLCSVLLIGVGIYVQLRLEETAEFSGKAVAESEAAEKRRPRSPVVEAILHHPRHILLAAGIYIANNICFYVAITYALAYGTSILHIPKSVMLSAVMIGAVVMVPALIISGYLSDKLGRLRVFMAGAVLSAVWTLWFFPLLETRTPIIIICDLALGFVPLSMMYGPQAALFAELFPVEVRYSGASLGYQIGAVCGAGLAPLIATMLYEEFKTTTPIGFYMLAACVVSFLCAFVLSRGRRQVWSGGP